MSATELWKDQYQWDTGCYTCTPRGVHSDTNQLLGGKHPKCAMDTAGQHPCQIQGQQVCKCSLLAGRCNSQQCSLGSLLHSLLVSLGLRRCKCQDAPFPPTLLCPLWMQRQKAREGLINAMGVSSFQSPGIYTI